ncbi:MAG: hypothetical protein OXL96_27205 [Candidatus Poribacteria bacterium]|nr:hypothetical protein [Candidatus Poribacteria bacterium]
MYDIYARCDEHCKSEHCDDYGADYCADWHTEAEHFQAGHGFCAKMAFLSHGCAICQEYWAIWREIQDGETPKRICHECLCLFELNTENPYGDVLYDEGTGAVYFECDECCVLESSSDDISESGEFCEALGNPQNVTFCLAFANRSRHFPRGRD